jgi:hypothetical protein
VETPDSVKDELEIRNLIARLAHLADNDSDDLEAYLDCFTADGWREARFHVKDGSISVTIDRGWDELRQAATRRRARGLQGPGSQVLHAVNTTTVWIDGDTARTKSYWQTFKNIESKPVVGHVGIYHDTFQRTPQGWKMTSRLATDS